MNEQALLKAIAKHPTDQLTLLAYADYLEENEKEHSAEFRYLADNIEQLYKYKHSSGHFGTGYFLIIIPGGMWLFNFNKNYKFSSDSCVKHAGYATYQTFADMCVKRGMWVINNE
jgi:uncharacterized protein (TIGR02996 family)